MDTIALVGNQIDEGGRLIEALTRGGLSVNAAVWVRPAEDDRWALYLVSDEVDTKGPLVAYRAAAEALREIPGTSLTMSEIKLVGTEDAQARSLLDVLRGSSGATPARMRRSSLGGIAVEEVYIYPLTKRPHTELSDDQRHLLEGLYSRMPLAVDDLPYTDEMEQIHEAFVRNTGLALTTRDVFKALKNLGRQGKLGGKIRTPQPEAGATSLTSLQQDEASPAA